MPSIDEVRQKREKRRKRSNGMIKKVHALHKLCEVEVVLAIRYGDMHYLYRSDDWTTWPRESPIQSGSPPPGSSPSCDEDNADSDAVLEATNQVADVSTPSEQLRREMAASRSTCLLKRKEDSLKDTWMSWMGLLQGSGRSVEAGAIPQTSPPATKSLRPACVADHGPIKKPSAANSGQQKKKRKLSSDAVAAPESQAGLQTTLPLQREANPTSVQTHLSNEMEAVVRGLPRSDLLDCLKTHWQILTTEGIFAMPSYQVLPWTLEGGSEQACRLQYHLLLRNLDIEDDLHQWRRSIAERKNLDAYNAFFTEAQAKHSAREHKRRSGERSSSKAHFEYLAHIYADRIPKDYHRMKQGLQKDLRNGRRWSILIDGFITDDGSSIPGLGLGFLLFCGAATAKGTPADRFASYNTTKYSDPYWKALVTYIHCSYPNILTKCELMRSAAESLVYDGRLRDDIDFDAVSLGLKRSSK